MGPLLFLSSLQYFVVQLLVASRWRSPYSLSRNTISDLGNTRCGVFSGRLVCSPLHALMNLSFVGLGVTMIAGSLLISRAAATTRSLSSGLGCLAISGVGVILVGTFPENSNPGAHAIGAALSFLVGNLGVVTMGLSRSLALPLRLIALTAGATTLVALVFYVEDEYLGLGEGGMERIVAYPQTIWLVALGAYLLTRPKGLRRREPRARLQRRARWSSH